MYQDMNQQMEEARQQIFRRKKLSAMLEELQKQHQDLIIRIDELKNTLNKENEDVDKLEHQSIAHLFYSVLGKLGEQVEKERMEALAAKLKYDQAVVELEQLQGRIGILDEEFAKYRDCGRTYDTLYEKKREHMINSHSQTGEQILQLNEELSKSKNNLEEIEEAIQAGNDALEHIDSALGSLDSAQGWGTWDLMGGGLMSDLMKHSHIDEAQGEAVQIQLKLSQFRTELADVRIQNEIHFETEGFGKFADFFFDGLIADWCMQSRIADSKSSIESVRQQVETVQSKLSNMKSMEDTHQKEILSKINTMIINA